MGGTFPNPQPSQNEQREHLRERFLNVIRMAGYRDGAPESICNEWFDKYMENVPEFIKMMEDYERHDGDPD
jgi:hypothetical protein